MISWLLARLSFKLLLWAQSDIWFNSSERVSVSTLTAGIITYTYHQRIYTVRFLQRSGSNRSYLQRKRLVSGVAMGWAGSAKSRGPRVKGPQSARQITGCAVAQAVLTVTYHSYGSGSLAWLSDFFRPTSGGQNPQPILTQNGSNDVHLRKDVPFAVKIATFHTHNLQGP